MAMEERYDHTQLLHFLPPMLTELPPPQNRAKPKPYHETSSSRSKSKSPQLEKQRDKPYLSIVMAKAMYRGNASVGVRDVHLPAVASSMRGGYPSLRCHATGGNDTTSSAAVARSCHRTCGRTRRSPWTRRGGTDRRMSSMRSVAHASSAMTSATTAPHRPRGSRCHGAAGGGGGDGGVGGVVHATRLARGGGHLEGYGGLRARQAGPVGGARGAAARLGPWRCGCGGTPPPAPNTQ
jgi:hypothetical protein